MTLLLLVAEWVHLVQCVLLTGAFFLLLLAGQPTSHAARRWERWVLGATGVFVVVALTSGVVVLAAQTALFEGRPEAALEPGAIGRAMLGTRPGVWWMARIGLLLVLGAFLALGGNAGTRSDWIAARGEALALSALALVLVGTSSHAAVGSEGLWPGGVELAHLLAAGVWAGGLPPLALLLFLASRDRTAVDPFAVRAMRRFSGVALAAVLVLAGSGVASAWLLVEGVTGLLGTAYGHWLLVKLALLVPALLLAAASRAALADLASPTGLWAALTARRMSLFIGAEAGLVLLLVGGAAAMAATTPGLHDDVVWPLPFRLALEGWSGVPIWQRLASPPSGLMLALAGVALVAVAFLVPRRPLLLVATVMALLLGKAVLDIAPLMARAHPTSFARPTVPYSVGSITQGMAVFGDHCASCHGGRTPARGIPLELLALGAASQRAGDLFWAVSHGRPELGMPEFATQLEEAPRWHAIHYLRALGMAGLCAAAASQSGNEGALDHAWLAAPDFPIAMGPLTPQALSHMPDLFQGCMTHALSTGYWSTAIAKDQFVAKPDVRAFLKMAQKNEPGLLRIFAPTLLVQGTADVTVLPGDTDDVAKQLCFRGNDLEYKPIAGADHNGSMQKGGAEALACGHCGITHEPVAQAICPECLGPLEPVVVVGEDIAEDVARPDMLHLAPHRCEQVLQVLVVHQPLPEAVVLVDVLLEAGQLRDQVGHMARAFAGHGGGPGREVGQRISFALRRRGQRLRPTNPWSRSLREVLLRPTSPRWRSLAGGRSMRAGHP